MENNEFKDVIIGTNEFIINAITAAVNAETEKNKKMTEYFLSEYFIETDKDRAKFYYDNGNMRKFYNLIDNKVNKFEIDICNLAKNHKRLYINMIDRRTDEVKMLAAKNFGYFMEDLNFNVFDFINNLMTMKYQDDDKNLIRDSRKCMLNTCRNTKETSDKKKELEYLKDEAKGARLLNRILNKHQKELLKSHIYQSRDESLKESDDDRTMLIYIGCGMILKTDKSWLNIYKNQN